MARGPGALPPDTDLVDWLLSLSAERRAQAIEMMGVTEGEALDRDWESWAHDGQHPPPASPEGAGWRTWVIMAGRGFGKTLAGSHWITAAIAAHSGDSLSGCPPSRAPGDSRIDCPQPLSIALVGATLDEARRVMVEGRSGLLEVADAWVTDWQPSLRRLKFRTGAEATLFSGASPEQLRGPEHHLAWCDELAKWEKPDATWDMLQLGLRLGPHPRALITTTPRAGTVLTAIMAAPDTVTTGGPTSANPHVSPAWQRAVHALYAGTRLGRQELDGELLTDTPGALWTVELLERCRAGSVAAGPAPDEPSPSMGEGWVGVDSPESLDGSRSPPLPKSLPIKGREFTRLVIAVDPPSGDGTCGIVACAKDAAGIAHVLADHSVTARTPEGWSRAVADAVRIHSQNPPRDGEGDHAQHGGGGPPPLPVLVVAEKNQGGFMVAAVLRTADPNLRVKLVTAAVGKAERAAPVAMLFEAGKVVLHGRFPELEAELLGMVAGGEYEGPGVSPDRADAMVWGLTELILGSEQAPPSVRTL